MYNLQSLKYKYEQLSIELESSHLPAPYDDTADVFGVLFVSHVGKFLVDDDWLGNRARVAILETLVLLGPVRPVEKFWVVGTGNVVDCDQNGIFVQPVGIPPLFCVVNTFLYGPCALSGSMGWLWPEVTINKKYIISFQV